jgi:hypothetical protein
MKKSNLSVLGMLAVVLAFGFMLAGCPADAEEPRRDQETGGVTAIEELKEFLDDAKGGESADDPISVKLVNLTENAWKEILVAIEAAEKYVDLDVTECQWETVFDPGTYDTGEKFIVGLALPDAANSIQVGTPQFPTFQYFTNLKTLSAAEVTSIGTHAFYNCTSLETVSLPATQTAKVDGIFRETSGGSSAKITIVVPNDTAVTAYTTAWGVDAVTAAGGKPSVYGDNHNAVTIEAAVQ